MSPPARRCATPWRPPVAATRKATALTHDLDGLGPRGEPRHAAARRGSPAHARRELRNGVHRGRRVARRCAARARRRVAAIVREQALATGSTCHEGPADAREYALEGIEAIESAERRALVEHRVPGMEGSYLQDLGSAPNTIVITGTRHGDERATRSSSGVRAIVRRPASRRRSPPTSTRRRTSRTW